LRPSNRFLPPDHGQGRPQRATGPSEQFAEGHWPAIRVALERQGWSHAQIELVHDQLRQGWPLEIARRHAAQISGFCPLRARSQP